jgi:hypothetical protein
MHTWSARVLGVVLVGGIAIAACGPGDAGGSAGSGGSAGTGGAGGGSGGSAGYGSGPPALVVVDGAPAQAVRPPPIATFSFDGYATAAGTRSATTVFGSTLGALEVGPSGPSWLPLVGDAPDLPPGPGTARAVIALATDVMVVTETGVYIAKDGVLTRSVANDVLHPLAIEGGTSRLFDGDGDGQLEAALALRTSLGLVELAGDELVTWSIEGESGTPSAAFAQESTLFVAYGERAYEVDKAKGLAYPLVFEGDATMGTVRHMACSVLACGPGSVLVFATDRGLVERSPAGDYTLYTLAEEGAKPVGVEGFALDEATQRLYAVTQGAVLRVLPGELPTVVAPLDPPAPGEPSSVSPHAAVDSSGDVWVGRAGIAFQLDTGTPLSFAADIRPIVSEYCAGCHALQEKPAPLIDFESYDVMLSILDSVVARVQNNSMPPKNAPPLPAEQVALFLAWASDPAP